MKKWIPVLMVIGLVLAIPCLALSHEGAHDKDKHESGKMFEEGSGTSAMEHSEGNMKSEYSDHKKGEEYEEGSGGMKKMHKDDHEYSDHEKREGSDKSEHEKKKSHRMKEGS